MLLIGLVVAILAAGIAFAVTAWVRRNAVAMSLMQQPNNRSSHTVATPGGGGIGIVAGGSLAALLAVAWLGMVPLVVLSLSLLVTALGFIDDRSPVAASIRLPIQLALSAAMVVVLPVDKVDLGLPPLLVDAGLTLATVYWLNIFNFMDGIDGIAGSETITVLLGAVLVAAAAGADLASDTVLWWLVGLAAATFGFLLLNWPPAKIFMGDAGSTFLGFMIAALALLTIHAGWLSIWQWLILVAAFVSDATVTLVRRMLLRERLFEAHRRHAYQVLSRRWQSHLKVTLLLVAINVLWLVPLALLAGRGPSGALVALVAYAPLVVLAVLAEAGKPEAARTSPR
jgi:Fuc2NAc and GlcNAc transferase